MILFTPLKEIPDAFLLEKGIDSINRYNLTSYYSDIETLNHLIPSPEFIAEDVLMGTCEDASFDVAYHSFIINNNEPFIEFMKLIVPEFLCNTPLTIVNIHDVNLKASPYRDAICESLAKLIQQRYGINVCYVYNFDDLMFTDQPYPSVPGLFIADMDMHRWRSLSGVANYVSEYDA